MKRLVFFIKYGLSHSFPSLAMTAIYLLIFLLFTPVHATTEMHQPPSPTVVVSLKPIHSWVCTLMEGRGKPLLLLEGRVSPHTAVLRPKDLIRVKQADLMIWIGPSFETSLTKLMQSIPAKKRVTLQEHAQLNWLPQRQGSDWEHSHKDHHDPHDHALIDGHIWLDPIRSEKIVLLLVEKLSEKDPLYRTLYQKNGADLLKNLQKINQMLIKHLVPLKERPFFVMHDAYQYLEDCYGLLVQGVILLSPEHPPSGKHLQKIKQRVQAQKKTCVFLEPQLQFSSAVPFLRMLGAREGVIDPLGANLPEGPAFYEKSMEQLVTGFEACLCP